MRERTLVIVLASAALLAPTPALSHHSNSAFEVEKIIELKGVVTKWQWVNPHTWIYLAVPDGRGGNVDWQAEGRAPGVLRRVGWERTTLSVGETVTIHCSPAKDGSHTCLVARVTKADGTVLSNGGGNQ